jgi:hypothetical protein
MKGKWIKVLIIAGLGLFIGTIIYMAFTYDKIKGTDDKISEVTKIYVQKAGVAQRAPYINTDKGDILLFLFGFSGLVVGFYLGYNWKQIITPKLDGK